MKKLIFIFVLMLSACNTQPKLVEEIPGVVESEKISTQIFDSAEFAKSPLNFTAEIPEEWQSEYISEIEAINIFDPAVEAESNLEKSQIFIRYFNASQFLTLNSVTIYSQGESTINKRPAVTYDIEKKSGVANFAYQPIWRNQRHFVTDIRSSENSPATFYVFAKNPDLSQDIFDDFLKSLVFN